MTTWFWTNLSLTILALAFASLNAKAPHRLRFLICFVALCSWMVPWGQIGRFVPARQLIQELVPYHVALSAGTASLPPASDSSSAGLAAILLANASVVLLAATVIGALLFVISSVRYLALVRVMSLGSVSANELRIEPPWDVGRPNGSKRKPELRIQREVSGAVTTGIFMPTIWLHENLVGHPDLRAALLHEFRHVRNHDNAYLWVITLVERLFWWNPLSRYLAWQTRRLQELSCDEACANDLAGYRDMLKRLIVASSDHAAQPCPQAPYIHHSNSFNVQRLRTLERRYVMKTRHYLNIVVLLIGSSITLTWSLAQNASERSPVGGGCPPASKGSSIEEVLEHIRECTAEDLGPIPRFQPGTTLEEAERLYRDMVLYAKLMERQYERQEAEIESLRQELEALQEPQFAENQ
jgi:beta-lactamase regulating signal transducer with metallopeptidase domain